MRPRQLRPLRLNSVSVFRTHLDWMLASLPPLRLTGGVSTVAAERECERWLQTEFLSDPNSLRTKASFREGALRHFNGRLTQRGFGRAWDSIAPSCGRSRPGRKS